VNGIFHPFEVPPAEGAAVEVAAGILWMRLPLPMALDHVNVYALEDGDGWTVVDTGLNSRRTRDLWQNLLAGPLAGRAVRRLIVTHHHPDHVGLAGWFQQQGVELLMTRTAWLYARMLVLDEQQRPSPQAMEFYTRAGLTAEMLAQKVEERPFNFCDIVAPMPVGFTLLHEGQQITMGGRDWTIRLGSGHAPDHATFWHPDVILGGDQLLPGISANIGVYPTEPTADPLSDWLESCQRLATHAQESHLVLPGHKLPFTGLPLRLRQMEENHNGALERLTDHLQSPRRAIECFPALFKREIGPAEFGLALAETIAHLNHLLRKGMVSRDLSSEGSWIWQKA
jgi:glyoxylase-like metal-dependent hydrolase (beta-lactamase superfamily II)